MTEPAKDELKENSTLFKWLIGLGVAGVAAVGGWVGSTLRENMNRDDKIREYFQQEIDKGRTERIELAKAIVGMSDSSKALTKAVETQTDAVESQTKVLSAKLDTMISDQRRFPAVREAYAKPEQP